MPSSDDRIAFDRVLSRALRVSFRRPDQCLSIRTAESRARIPAFGSLEVTVTALRNVSQRLRVLVELRIQVPGWGPSGLIDTCDQSSP